jgi:hypothetical protein
MPDTAQTPQNPINAGEQAFTSVTDIKCLFQGRGYNQVRALALFYETAIAGRPPSQQMKPPDRDVSAQL